MKKAFITGITGQDGSYLAEFLLEKGYYVYGLIRRASTFNTERIDHIFQDPHEKNKRLILRYGDLSDGTCISSLLREIEPDEIYNLGAQSHVRVSFDIPIYTADITGLGPLRLLECIREIDIRPKFYQASSSEMYGNPIEIPQNENTPFLPRSPYGASKLFAFNMAKNYREAYDMFICNGILFNHESPRRGETFVTRKITRAAARIKLGLEEKIYLGNIDSKRDWGFARDYVEAMWLMLQQDKPDDYVIATGESHSVKEFLEKAFNHVSLDYKRYLEIDKRYFRPTEVFHLEGDSTKAREKLGWKPKVGFDELIKMMVDADLKAESK